MDKKAVNKNKQFLQFALNNKAIFLMVIVAIIAVCFSSAFLNPNNLINVLRQVCSYAILGLGFTLLLTSGNIDLSIGYMVAMVGVSMAQVSKMGVPWPFVILIGMAIGVLCGLINGSVSIAFNLPPFIVTLATAQVYRGICNMLCNNSPVSGLPEFFKVVGVGRVGPIPISILIMLALLLIYSLILYKTKLGRHISAMGGNAEAARVCGVNINRTKLAAYALMGLCVALASLLLTGRAYSAQPTAGVGMEMDAIAAVVIGGTSFSGGKGNTIGTVFGCIIIGIINNMLTLAGVDANWQYITKGLIILFAVVIDSMSSKILAKRS